VREKKSFYYLAPEKIKIDPSDISKAVHTAKVSPEGHSKHEDQLEIPII